MLSVVNNEFYGWAGAVDLKKSHPFTPNDQPAPCKLTR